MARQDTRTRSHPSRRSGRGAFTLVGLPAASRRIGAAFTLVELLVVIAIIALLVTILAPMIGRTVEIARRGKCASNIKAIVSGCHVYAMEGRYHRGSTPKSLPYQIFKGPWYGPQGNKSCLWLLIDHQLAVPEQFVCPSLRDYKPAALTAGEFGSKTFGYAFQSQVQLRLTKDNIGGNRVIVGDINPRFADSSGAPVGALDARSPAHKSDGNRVGQTIGCVDGSARFIEDPKVPTGANLEDWIYQSSSPSADDEGCSRGGSYNSTVYGAFDDVFLVN